jgi:hypothetical protein
VKKTSEKQKMGPKKDGQDKQQKILDFNNAEDQPAWARNMENRLTSKFNEVTESVRLLELRMAQGEKETEQKFRKVEERMDDFEFHQRKYNLLFFGLPDQIPAERAVKKFLKEDLGMAEADSILLQHCHPLPAGRNGTKPVIARFVCFADRDKVLRALPKLRGKGVKVSVSTDLPRRLRMKRAELLNEMRDMRKTDSSRVLRVVERGQEVRIEEKKGGTWNKIN